MKPIRFDDLDIDYKLNRGVGTQTINTLKFRSLYHFNKKEATMKFSIGDRVEVTGVKNEDFPVPIGSRGTIKNNNTYGDNENEYIRKIYWDNEVFNSSRHTESPYVCNIKLITKGNDMEIEVGQVWEYVRKVGSVHEGSSYTVKAVRRGNVYWTNGEQASISFVTENAKLITNIKGDNKMEKKTEKKIKINTIPLKEKMGVKTDNGVSGNIYSMSPQIVVVEDENGKHHSCQSKDVEILYSVPEEAVNPKTKVMTKAEAKRIMAQAKKVLAKK